MFRVNGKPAIGLAIAMRDSGDILALGHNVRAEMADITANLPHGIEPVLVADQAVTVDEAINDFMASLWQAIIIILACSFVSLGVRPGAVVALAIPLTLAIVFAVMDITNTDLHRISLGALIIALTLLVDDAMTTVDAMIRRLGAGDTKDEAATFAYRTLAAPMLIGTLVTISSFVPIGFARSSAGEYTFSIFSVVAMSLIVSWLVAVMFAPLIGKAILKVPKAEANAKPSKLIDGYSAFLRAAIRANWLTIGLTIGAFVVAIFLLRFVPQQFFPASDRPELTVDLTLRQNASIYATEAQVERLEAIIKADPDVDHFSAYVGRGAIRFILTLNVQLANPFFAQFVIVAKDLEARERLQQRLEQTLAEQFPDVVSRVSPLELGPPVGWPLQYRVSGPDQEEVRRIALDFANVLASDPRTRHVHFDWMEPARQVRVNVDQDEARRLGVSSRALAAVLNASVTGSTVTQLRDDIYLVNVIARATDTERASFETLSALQVPTPSGRMVPLQQFATFVEEQEFPLVWRRDRVPTLTVRADVTHGVLPDSVVSALAPKVAEFDANLPHPYRIVTGGLYEESATSSASVFAVVPLMIVLMLSIMMLMLVSFRRLAMVVSLLPLGLIGVVLALLVIQPAARLRRDSRHPRADRHDREERGDPRGADRDRQGRRQKRARRRDVGGDVADAAADADRDFDGARADSDRTDRVLGSDGVCDHGRAAGGNVVDAGSVARSVCHGVRQRTGTGCDRADVTSASETALPHSRARRRFSCSGSSCCRARNRPICIVGGHARSSALHGRASCCCRPKRGGCASARCLRCCRTFCGSRCGRA